LFQTNLYAGVTTGYKLGKGPLKLTKHMVNELEFFFSGGTRGAYAEKQKSPWKPGLIAISVDGNTSYMFRHPLHVTQVDSKAYWGIAISNCKKKSGQECYLFANGYKIVWDNGSNKKKRRLKKKDIKAGKTVALLTELGFYDNNASSSTKTPKKVEKKETKKNSVNDKDIVQKLKDLKELLDSGVLTDEEFEKAKKKLLN
tara:strand:+ start:363 stop:962 length:600 start_codon:yes stop_codon:yes gene_type:complete